MRTNTIQDSPIFNKIDPRIAFSTADFFGISIFSACFLHYSFLANLTARYHDLLQSIEAFPPPLFSWEALLDDENPDCTDPLFAFDINVSLRQLIRGNMIRSSLPDLWSELEKEGAETRIRLLSELGASY